MEVATKSLTPEVALRMIQFQHLFFLMEVATKNTPTHQINTIALLFQHLFFLMEVATGIGGVICWCFVYSFNTFSS